MSAPIPLTVIGGFLGAGKTTLLNHVLKENHGIRFAVMVNDFGDLAIDDQLIAKHGGDTLTFANGCVCCTLGDNFMRSLDDLLSAQQPPQQFLVEASGVADPRSIADIAVLHPRLRRDLVLILVAADSIRERANDDRICDTVQRQLEAADMIALNKIDLVTTKERASLRQWLGEYGSAPVIETENAHIPLAVLTSELASNNSGRKTAALNQAAGDHHHDDFSTITIKLGQPLELETLRQRLTTLPPSVLRIKGFVRSTEPGNPRYLVQRSGRQIELRLWDTDDPDVTAALVFIGTKELPESAVLEVQLSLKQ